MKLPGLRSGARVVSGDEHMVDRLQERLGVAATIFACDGGEFVRVSTSVRDERGKRVLGTRLDPSHPAVACLIDKRAYEGSMVLFGHAYMTRYDPIFDSRGSLIGAFFVGVEMSASRPARERARAPVRNRDSARRADARVDTNVLEKARFGVYPLERMEKMPAEHLRKYFLRGTGAREGMVKVRPELRELISFRQINLIEPQWCW